MRVLFLILSVFIISTAAQTDSTRTLFNKGTLNARSGEYEKATENYRQAITITKAKNRNEKLLAQAHYNLGICLFHTGQIETAIEEFNQAIDLSHGQYQKPFYALGMAHSRLSNWAEAEQAFLKSLSIEKTDGEAWFDLGLVYLELKNFPAAQAAFQNSISYESISSSDAHNNLGVIYALGRNFQSAVKEFEMALRDSKGQSIEAVNNLQFCRQYKKDDDETDLTAKLLFSKKINSGENNG